MHIQHKIKTLQKIKKEVVYSNGTCTVAVLFTLATDFIFLLCCYSPLCTLASLMISLHRPVSHAFFHHAFTSKILRSSNTESSHLSLGFPFFLLPSGWEKVIFMQGTLLSFLTVCPNH